MLSLSQLIYQGRTDFDEEIPTDQPDCRENDEPQRRPTNSSQIGMKRPREKANNTRQERKKPAGILKKRPKEEVMNQRNIRFSIDQEEALNDFYFGENAKAGDAQSEVATSPVKLPPAANVRHDDDVDDDVGGNHNDNDEKPAADKKKRLICPPIVVSTTSKATIKKPRRRKLIRGGRIPYKRKLTEQEIEKYYKTPEQEKEDIRKNESYQIHTQVRRNWKKRKANLQNEVDVGDAISTLARKVLREERKKRKREERKKRKKEERKKRKRQQQDEAAAAAAESDNDVPVHDDPVDSSDEEREAALGSLLRNPEDRLDKPNAAAVAAATDNDPLLPNEASEDYFWKMGYTAPPKHKLQFDYINRVRIMEAPLDLDEVTISEEMFNGPLQNNSHDHDARWSQWSNQYFPLSRDALSKLTFVHQRHLRQMAARFIVASADDTHNISKADMDQRLLRLLFRHSKHQASRLNLLMEQARETGRNLELYRQYEWKNSSAVAARLGVAASQEFGTGWTDQLPIPFLSEHSMHRAIVQQAGLKERRLLMKQYAIFRLKERSEGGGLLFVGGSDGFERIGNSNNTFGPDSTPYAAATGQLEQSSPFASCNYLHLPGSIPPIPIFPLDATQIVFGPTDQHAHASHACRLDSLTYNLTICSLISNWSIAMERKSDDASGWWNQIINFIEQAPHLNSNKLYKRILNHNKRIETDNFPLVGYYNTMMGYCSLVANLLFASSNSESPTHFIKRDDSSETSEDGEIESGSCDYSVVARTIHDFCESHTVHNSLQHFPKLRTIFALASVAKILPPSAAEILSRPLDDIQLRTPMDVMRLTLEHLEGERMLVEVESGRSSFGQKAATFVTAGELEYALYRASKILADSVGREPHNLEHHLWYLSALSGSLLLCSGLRIGGKVRRFPSTKSSSRHIKRGDRHVEVRCMLRTYGQVRREVAEGLLRVVRLAREQNGCRSHLAVSSFLEWKQVVALLMGPADDFETIRKLHSMHALSWAESNPQELSHRYVSYLRERNLLDTNRYMAMLAAKIENDPSQSQVWRQLVAALGPVGVIASDTQKKECREEYCIECGRLGRELNVDHAHVKSIKCNPDWWAKTRMSWWLNHPLSISVPLWPTEVPYDAYDKMAKQLRACNQLLLEDLFAKVLEFKAQSQNQGFTEEEMLQWLPCKESDRDKGEDLALLGTLHSSMAVVHADMLPTPFYEVYDATKGNELEDNLDIFSPPVSLVNRHLEALCQKVIVTCHIYGNTHENVIRAVEYLLRQCIPDEWENTSVVNQNCDAWRCLVWLTSFGLNLSKIIYPRVGPPPKSRYSIEEQEAVLRGIRIFGVGKWMAIKYEGKEVLAGSTHFRVRDIYRWLLKRGKVSEEDSKPTQKAKTSAPDSAKNAKAGKTLSDKAKQTKSSVAKKRPPKNVEEVADDTSMGDAKAQAKPAKRPAVQKRASRNATLDLDCAADVLTVQADNRVKQTKRLPVKKRAPRKTTTPSANGEKEATQKTQTESTLGKQANHLSAKRRATQSKVPLPKKAKLNHFASEIHDVTLETTSEIPESTHETHPQNYDMAWASHPSTASVASANELDNVSVVAV